MVLNYQMGSEEEDIPRYKKMISKSKDAKAFSKKDRARITAELKAELGEEELEMSGSDDDADEDDSAGDSGSEDEDSEDDFIVDDSTGEPTMLEKIKEIGQSMSKYKDSEDEQKDLLENYNKCAGNWDLILQFQPGSSEEDLPRYKKQMKKLIKAKKAKRFTAQEQERVAAQLSELAGQEEDLGDSGQDSQSEEDDEDEDSDGGDDEMKEFIEDDAEGDDSETEAAQAQVEGIIQNYRTGYRKSNTEEIDLVDNYNKCGGDWEMILHFQPASLESDLPRYKKIIKKMKNSPKLQTFSAEERQSIVAQLEDDMAGEEDLEASDGEADEDSDEPDEDDLAFIAADDEEDDEASDEMDEMDEMDETAEKARKADKKQSKKDKKKDKKDKKDKKGKSKSPEEKTPKQSKKGNSKLVLDSLVQQLSSAPNLPTKPKKFAAFLRNTYKITDEDTINKCFEALKK